jgi:redox-sensitive bicupin YhaK (pirin superfamily)
MTTLAARRILHRTSGHGHGITRLMSPGDLGELVKPFVFLDHFESDGEGMGNLPWHPHSGIATHTTLLQGDVTYEDSTGKSGTLSPGSIEYMQAGGGVWHTGGLVPGQRVRGFQLWLALPDEDELAPPQSHYVEASRIPSDGQVRVLLGTYGALTSPIPYRAPLTYLHVRLRQGERWRYVPAPGHDVAWLAVSEGALAVGGVTLAREMAVFEDGNAPIEVVAGPAAEFVLGSAARHHHPLVLGTYSVHSSDSRLRRGLQGIRDVAARLRDHLPE